MTLAKFRARKWDPDLKFLKEILGEHQSIDINTQTFPKGFRIKEAHLLVMGVKQWDREQQQPDGLFEPDALGWYPIHHATTFSDLKLGKYVIDDYDPNVRDLWGWAPLHNACLRGDATWVDELIDAGAETSVVATDGVSPMHCAAKYGKLEVAKMLLKEEGSEDVVYKRQTRTDLNQRHPIHWAAVEGHKVFVKLMVGDKDLQDRSLQAF
ncbi:unnamed protein product [Clonostachys solani]|uniref:Uncharacterized protein n=1 Tax=Clonostachys solani TaxID=160281 RepID=A0A9N9YU56_9HYPO|nr:unnamed protein product [Clonostachys solani]